MPNATAWLIFDQNYWDEVRDLRRHTGRRRARLPPPRRHAGRARGQDRRRRGGAAPHRRPVQPRRPRRRRDPQFQRGETLFDRYFGAFYPRLGRNSPDARFPAATAKARVRHRHVDRSGRQQARGTGGEEERPRAAALASWSGPWRRSSAPCWRARGRACWARSTPRPTTRSRSRPARSAPSAVRRPTRSDER